MNKTRVYLFTGFLESGKSSFIQDTLLEQGFGEDEKTLIIACEEGEVTFDIPALKKENASVEFDVNTLSPTYKLLVGIPGKSNAFAISKKLGLSDNIINKAKSLMSSDAVNIEELLKTIYDDKSLIEKEKEEIQKQLNQINLLRNL